MKKFLSVFTALMITLSLFAVTVSAASPKLNKTNVNLPKGYSVTLKGSNASGKVEWSVKDSSVASVKAKGDNSAKVVGKKTGFTYVYAKTGGKTLKCAINVKKSVISVSSSSLDIEKGKSKTITLSVKGSKSILAVSENPDVCSVAWGKKWDGDKITLTITAKKNGSGAVRIYNKDEPDSSKKTVLITVGKTAASTAQTKKENTVSFGGTADNSTNKTNTNEASDTSKMIVQVAELVNKERSKAGKSELELDDTLNEIAALRAEEITRAFSHDRPDGSSCFTAFEDAGIVNVYEGENIAAWQQSADEVMKSWMNSTGHKKNILSDDYTRIGVGCYFYDGRYYWVQEFAS
ncbi:MAG: CAP domain-containing protein [Oscillospiraceae bacterium]|nr:CAP domain-containing protein [Oscillospiraceae bacterium]